MTIRILVVDDASFIRDMVKKHLREGVAGVEVFEAVDGNRALSLIKKQSMDLILSDWEMPNMGGEELLRAIRGSEEGADVPFVMVSSRGDRDHVVKAVQAGVSDYLAKPFTPDELLRKVAKQLAKAGKAPAADAIQRQISGGSSVSSVGILTGGGKKAEPEAAGKPKKVKGRAQLRFSSRGARSTCVLRELSLQTLTGLVQRGDALPMLFDPVVVDMETDDGTGPSGLNGYVHSIQAGENSPETKVIRLTVRFVDQDKEKFDALSRYIGQV